MKRLLFCLVIVLPQYVYSQGGPAATFFQLVDVSNYKGAGFSAECWMYADKIAPDYGAVIIASAVNNGTNAGNKIGEFYAADFKPGEWNKLTLKGKLDKHAPTLAIGIVYGGDSKFYFDDLKLTIQEQEIPLKDGNFESAGIDNWMYMNKQKEVAITKTEQYAHDGKQSLFIDCSNVRMTAYGSNKDHGHYADINGNHIYYETYGMGKPVLLLHGCLEEINHFSNQIPELSKSHQVIAMDTRGHGKSSIDTGAVSYERFADDVYQLLNTLHLDSVDIVGWSDGGITGLILAMQHPEKVGKLAVMGANLYNDESAVYKWVNDEMKAAIQQQKGKTDSRSQFIIKMSTLVLEEPHIDPAALKKIQCPVLVMAGEKDAIKPGHTELIAKSIPNATLKIFKGATHYAPSEQPAAFNKAVIAFFDK